jgi:hypothetical protein
VLADAGTRYQAKLFNPALLHEKGIPVPDWLALALRAEPPRTIPGTPSLPASLLLT